MRITSDMKRLFFDRDLVQRKEERGRIRALSRFGAFVRQRARSKIRKRKRVSRPGEPPSAHTNITPNLRTIYFGYDPNRRSVIIGPVVSNSSRNKIQPVGATVPEVLEHGGTIRIPARRNQPARQPEVAARPYMGPAFEEERPNAPDSFSNIIRS